MVDLDKVHQLLDTYFDYTGDAEVQEDGSVNVQGDVVLMKHTNGNIPVKFGVVEGEFRAISKGLTSLINAPDTCDSLIVSSNLLTSLEYCPVYLNILNVENNKLTNFEHAPEQVDTIFAFNNPLTSLTGLPDSDFEYHINITYSENLPLLQLVNAESVNIGSPGLGYERLKPYEPVNSIINKYTGQGKAGAIKAAAELVKAGFKDNARW